MNARFWVYLNGDWVKLTLRPGQFIEHREISTDEEGYSAEDDHVWRYAPGNCRGLQPLVRYERHLRSRDCDGSYSGYEESACELHRLQTHHVPDEDYPPLPKWEPVGKPLYRDFTAERAGY